ncbi:MAG: NAD(P)/FAD-dependent oxidoreductase [Sneathiella sp.]|nr:NAD(P)/FAD-dependent oxidoreductase [Sneathiella sp.]
MPQLKNKTVDVVVIGAGAAGLMCAIEAGRRGRSVVLLEKADKVGKKILISGGGRCNFTNLFAEPTKYVSQNKHYCKSAFKRYDQQDFLSLVSKHDIKYHEKKLGQLFCDRSASEIVEMLVTECENVGVSIWTNSGAEKVKKGTNSNFEIETATDLLSTSSVVMATGGLSIPKMGANDFAFRMAKKWNLELTELRPGLVPFTFDEVTKQQFSGLTGISADVVATVGKTSFRENVLFTHKGVSGPAILQISSFWREGQTVHLDFLPDENLEHALKEQRRVNSKGSVSKFLSQYLANRLMDKLLEGIGDLPEFGNCSDKVIQKIVQAIKHVQIKPNGTEGYAKAEVTTGGVSTNALSSKTMEAKNAPGLYFIGEAVDVTGFLGGYNFQWAWSSGFVAGQYA